MVAPSTGLKTTIIGCAACLGEPRKWPDGGPFALPLKTNQPRYQRRKKQTNPIPTNKVPAEEKDSPNTNHKGIDSKRSDLLMVKRGLEGNRLEPTRDSDDHRPGLRRQRQR